MREIGSRCAASSESFQTRLLRITSKVTTHFTLSGSAIGTPVLHLCELALREHDRREFPDRDFLNRMHSDARRVQELLDPEFQFKLPSNRVGRHVEKVDEAIVHLATSFLSLSEDREVKEVLAEHECPRCADLVPEPISEESLRSVESMFHNLQSMYDTDIFETDVEQQNADLGYMRGHISIIFHLTEIATNLVHYYVRHMSAFSRASGSDFTVPMRREELLEFVFDYPIRFSRLYLESAVQLCQRMIRVYSVPASVEVPTDPAERDIQMRLIVMWLVREGGLVIYDTDLSMEPIDEAQASTIGELAAGVIRHFISMGKMDVRSDITVTFSGDSRAVGDIEILASNGYGEDRMGNNIELPAELSSLAR